MKYFPDGLIKNCKGWFCAREDHQIQGTDFFETCAPTVQQTMIYLMLILEVLLELKSKQGDITTIVHHPNLEEGENVFVEHHYVFERKAK